MNCRECKFCSFRPAMEHGMKASVAMCGLHGCSCEFAREPFDTLHGVIPEPADWCGENAARFEARAA